MARIRTVKPDLFRHEGLFELEQETGLPVRIAFVGLFTAADRDGSFKWRPRELQLDVMPYDQIDFSRVLDALATRGFLVKYRVDDAWYGSIPTFRKHQVINNRERASELPIIDYADEIFDFNNNDLSTRQSRVEDASPTRHGNAQGEGKGREGKGIGREQETEKPSKAEFEESFAAFWKLYPKKVSKADAEKAWKKIRPIEIPMIMQSLAAHRGCRDWVKDEGQFIPNAATWLNGKKFNDEVKPYVAGTNTGTAGQNRPSLVDRVRQANAHLFEDEQPPFVDEREWPEFDSLREIDGHIVAPHD